MLRSRGLGRLMNPRRITLTLGTAAGTAVAAALIGLANAPAATADTDLDPFQDLFGTGGINTWTPTADADLGALAGGFDTSVDNWQTGFETLFGSISFTSLADIFDPSAFSANPDVFGGLLPDNAIGDLAVGLDYTLFASGLTSLDVGILELLGPLFVVPA
jgi:hypothetical protein